MKIQWQLKSFEELTAHQLYQLLRLRSEVFVVEQQCIFLDMDNKDQQCYHLLGWKGELLAASTRLVPPGISYTEMSIGRVVSSPLVRGTGIGRELMEVSVKACYELWGNAPIRIGAQCYLEKFYQSLGFEPEGEIYLEDGIPHIEMVKMPS
ncbi:GNAT family N-acetyltransferase [Flavihumibacter cheonanensis]|jgi:ElaA protein|uniref:GNAT family N-acetyltransferase n=1 Tax=Flavihumibacter cheonanensis TaxID=1442385 RepID=UPI001EF88B7C|nr:GNAT family N-acetyltransferase [Flavihumibacter cheonanensis]MCG7754578.1 GNAT family N-acetyltransferase [Flavihumibacter cheonanensis]